MRTIKFRGKRLDNNEWVYGYLYELALPSGEASMILTQDNNHLDTHLEPKYHLAFTLWVDLFLVDPETVGQFTGLQDADGNDIYEGDMLLSDENAEVFEVVYDAPRFCFKDNVFGFRFLNHPEFFHVIGNRYDNPELIEEGGEA